MPTNKVSIPQAVSTVATDKKVRISNKKFVDDSFNTASGKHCGNRKLVGVSVSILRFNTASGKHCGNAQSPMSQASEGKYGFNTASGKHCGNVAKKALYLNRLVKFQYRKR